VKGVTRLQDTRLSEFAQFQFIQLQSVTELFTRERYPLAQDASYITELLSFVSNHSNERVRDAYQTFVRSLGVYDLEILKADFACLLMDDIQG
jgi:hypothetical protein